MAGRGRPVFGSHAMNVSRWEKGRPQLLIMSEETTDFSDGDFVEVWAPGGYCVAWGNITPDPNPEDDHHVVKISASFHPKFLVARRMRTHDDHLPKVELN